VKRLKTVPPRKAALVTSASFAALGPIYFLACNAVAPIFTSNENPIAVRQFFWFSGLTDGSRLQLFIFWVFLLSPLAAALVLKINSKIKPGRDCGLSGGVAFIFGGR